MSTIQGTPGLLALLLLSLIAFSSGIFFSQDQTSSLFPMLSGSQCFHVKGVPTLKLQCPGGQMIRVHQSFFGAPEENSTCSYKEGDKHCIQLADMQHNCMGRYMCYVHVSNPFLMSCRTYASYLQINYTCIPKAQTLSMCSTSRLSSRQGFLRSPNYPDANYTNNLWCQCQLTTQDKNGIQLQILDFDLHQQEIGKCESDYLAIAGHGRKCGIRSSDRLPETLLIRQSRVTLLFRSDSRHTGRGLWLQYSGRQGGKVTASCAGLQLPPSEKVSSSKKTGGPDKDNKPSTLLSNRKPASTHNEISKTYFESGENEVVLGNNVEHSMPFEKINGDNQDDISNIEAKVTVLDAEPKTHNTDEDKEKRYENMDTYDSSQKSHGMTNIDKVQVGTGTVVGVLILTAIIIIIVLVFKR